MEFEDKSSESSKDHDNQRFEGISTIQGNQSMMSYVMESLQERDIQTPVDVGRNMDLLQEEYDGLEFDQPNLHEEQQNVFDKVMLHVGKLNNRFANARLSISKLEESVIEEEKQMGLFPSNSTNQGGDEIEDLDSDEKGHSDDDQSD
jgi:hypothetical protein